ncbi:hypothetical protein [Sinomicrobium weinanense]|uniref:Uncharacterized protein n=1 Tax=Sinomicrobium weinanense TaxID=2842200 RepID=A0A926JQR1_9FLAO|nr:hypothetical protein [Sinomicrobium weinanense]MBC9795634.1 hypothetical protein [Sinomicrobium weinanense]MBU3124655.1 hypothetical protein [Sinomicrobium weinanense]
MCKTVKTTVLFRFFVRVPLLLPLLFLAVLGCSSENTIPDIYVDQISETFMDGENAVRKQYRDNVEICRSLGKKVSGLSEEEVKKLGVRRYQLAITAQQVAFRKESWGYRATGHYYNPGECRFTLVYSGELTVKVPGKTVIYDLAEKTVTEEEQGIPEAFGLPFRPLAETPDTEEMEPEDALNAERSEGEIEGQPTVRWTYPDGSIEVLWSGGRKWGFSEMPSDERFAAPGSMILEKETKKEKYTVKLKTRRFTVGTPIDQGPFTIPEAGP